MRLDSSMPTFYQQLAEQALAKAEMVASWGVTHPPTLGANRENTVRRLLMDILPSTLCFGTGFVMNDAMQISNQCDIIIYDDTIVPPLYRDEDIVILRHIAVAMVIEVKTTLGKTQLNDALFNIASAKTVAPHITGCIFSFLGPAKASATAKGWIEQFKSKGIQIPGKKQRHPLTPQTWADYIYAIRGRGKGRGHGFVAELDKNITLPQMTLRDCRGLDELFWFYQYILQHTLINHFPCRSEIFYDLPGVIDIEKLAEIADIARWLRLDIPKGEFTVSLT